MKKQYDYLLVGSGLFAGVFAYYAKKAGKTCLVLEKREHAGGNIYCENIEGINVHRYGAHIFHTSNKEVWNFVNSLVEFNRYTNSPVANYKGEMYNMPFNMNTFSRMWGISTPEEAKKIINEQRKVIKVLYTCFISTDDVVSCCPAGSRVTTSEAWAKTISVFVIFPPPELSAVA